MMMWLVSYLVYFVLFVVTVIWLYKQIKRPKKVVEKKDKVEIYWDAPPGSLDFYIRIIFTLANLTKPAHLRTGKAIPRFEVYCNDATPVGDSVKKFLHVCGFPKDMKNLPLTYTFCNSLPLMGFAASHPRFPLKPLNAMIHMKQVCMLLRPLGLSETVAKRGIIEGGENTDRGSEFCAITEVYTSSAFAEIVGRGESYFLVPQRKKRADGAKPEEKKEELPPVTKTVTFKVAENAGRRYAASSGDYNPWHMNALLAKPFGYRKAIAQGFYSVSRCLAEIGDRVPKYPLKLTVEWKRPLFMPSTVTMTERAQDGKILFELHSEDKQHLHLVGSVEHVPDMKL